MTKVEIKPELTPEEFEAQVSSEIVQHLREHKCKNFLPDTYRHWREQGCEPEDIDYDMCHIFR